MTTKVRQILTRAQLLHRRGVSNYARWKMKGHRRVEPDGPDDRPLTREAPAEALAVPVNTPITPPLDWSLYSRFKSEGRLNLLLRLSDPMVLTMRGSDILRAPDSPPPKIITFLSRAEQLRWRRRWHQGRFVILSWPPEQRAALLRQDAIFREADAEWEKRHGRVSGSADVLEFVASIVPRLKW